MNISEVYNPYDFANPVLNPNLFVGREAEISEIKYYLTQSSKAPRPINLAILGDRASGKTSLLNMIEIEAEKIGFCVVRIELDEADAETQLQFFHKLFDSILTSVCKQGAYSGLEGKTYEIYRDMVDGYEITEEKLFRPFVFPVQYAKAMSKGNDHVALSDVAFKEDLAKIHKEVKRPVAVLLDECNVLTKSRVHLEKLRNIFMNNPGFMMVMTGTPDLFPVMDEVFSPIIRQFKKISIGPFEKPNDTLDCIMKPLESIGIYKLSEIMPYESLHDILEIHELSGGRPYEIQLICHTLFRRVHEGRSKRMELTVDVLDEIRKELETYQDVSRRPALALIQNYNKRQLSALDVLCECNGTLTYEQIWHSEYVFRDNERWTEESLHEQLRIFENDKVLKVEDDIISFVGDEFDRIYCKYWAKRLDVILWIRELPFDVYLRMRFHSFFRKHRKEAADNVTQVMSGKERLDFLGTAKELLNEDPKSDPFEATPLIAEEVYWASLTFCKKDSFKLATVSISTQRSTTFIIYRDQDIENADDYSVANLTSLFSECSERAVSIGWNLSVEVEDIPVVPINVLQRKLMQSDNSKIREEILAGHAHKTFRAYLNQKNREEALFYADIAYSINPELDVASANNYGYLYLALNNLERAKKLLQKALKGDEKPEDKPITNYNLGVLEAKAGNFESALAQFKLVNDYLMDHPRGERVECLLLPEVTENSSEINFQEIWDPDLRETVQSAISAIEQFRKRNN